MSLRSKYLEDGFITPLSIYTPDEAAELYSNYREYVERYGEEGKLKGNLRFRLHVVAKWVRKIVFNPKLVEAVKDVLDTDTVLVWDSDLNIKAPGTQSFYSWHQDGAYSGHSPQSGVLTAWVCLSPAPEAAGCIFYCPGSHNSMLPHYESQDPNNVLSIGQTIPEEYVTALNKPVASPLQPGQVSLHHFVCAHASGPNTTNIERVGLAIRYFSGDVVNHARGGTKEHATLVCGEYTGDDWILDGDIEEEYGDKEWETHRRGAEKRAANYFSGTGSTGFKAQ